MNLWWLLLSTFFAGHAPTDAPNARACVRCPSSQIMLPTLEAGEVPADGRMLACFGASEPHWVALWRLTDSGERLEEPVPVTLAPFAFDGFSQRPDVRWVVPVEPLEPRARYELAVDGVTRFFEASADLEAAAPTLTEVTLAGPADPECAVGRVHSLAMDEARAPDTDLVHHVVVEAETATGWKKVAETVFVRSPADAAVPTLALSDCGSQLLGPPVRVRARVLGADGSASAMVTSNQLLVAPGSRFGLCHDDGGCSVAAGRGGPVGWPAVAFALALLGFLGARRHRLRRFAAGALTGALITAAGFEAHASCDPPRRCPCAQPTLTFPYRPSGLDVPANMKLLLPGSGDGTAPTWELREAELMEGEDVFRPGRRVPIVVESHEGTGAFWVSAAETLVPGRTYLLDDLRELGWPTLWLVTSERDDDVPVLEGLRFGSNLALVNCGEAAWLEMDPLADERTQEPDLVLEVLVEGPDGSRRLVMRGDTRRNVNAVWPCVTRFMVGQMALEQVSVTVYDLAGNAATSGPISLTLGPTPVAPAPPCGMCQVGGEGQGTASACVLAALMMLRVSAHRRRSRSSTGNATRS